MMFRSVVFNFIFSVGFVLFLIAALPSFLGQRVLAVRAVQVWGRIALWLLRVIVGMKVEVRGVENIPDGPLLMASKHLSAWDTVVLPLYVDAPIAVMKKELTRIPVYGWYCAKFGIPIDRSGGTAAMRSLVSQARQAIASGLQIMIFPEGTRRAPGAEPDYKPGVALLYRELGVPCLPVALNSGLYWPRKGQARYPGTVIVEFLPLIPPGLPAREFQARLQQTIEEATARLIAEAASDPHAPPTLAEAQSPTRQPA